MPTGPSAPKFTPRATPTPQQTQRALEPVREDIRQQAKRRTGFASTVLTEGVSLGEADIRRGKVTRLGLTT